MSRIEMLGFGIATWQICCRILVSLSVGGVRSRCPYSGVCLLRNVWHMKCSTLSTHACRLLTLVIEQTLPLASGKDCSRSSPFCFEVPHSSVIQWSYFFHSNNCLLAGDFSVCGLFLAAMCWCLEQHVGAKTFTSKIVSTDDKKAGTKSTNEIH